MDRFNNDDLEYVVDDYFDSSDFEDQQTFSDNVPQHISDSDSHHSDFEDNFDTVTLSRHFFNYFIS